MRHFPEFSSFVPGNEAIDFQVSSSLGKKLTDLFQQVIDYRDNLDYSRVYDDAQSHTAHRVASVYDYFKKNTGPAFLKIVEQETGLKIAKLYVFGGMDLGVNCCYAVDLSFGAIRDALETIGRQTGADNYTYGSSREAIDEMASMYRNLDFKTGKLKKTTFGKGRKIEVPAMYFDVNCAFLVSDFLVKEAVPMTAAEIAAIMMHEIGHALTMIEHSGDMFATYQKNRAIANAIQHGDPKEALAEIQSKILPVLTSLCKSTATNEPSASFLRKFAVKITTAVNNLAQAVSTNTDESWVITTFSTAFNVLSWILSLIVHLLMNIVYFVCLIHLGYELSKYSYVNETAMGTKAGDNKTNYNNLFLLERWADEFVSRQGFGPELARSLNKMDTYIRLGDIGEITSARLRNSTIFSGFCVVMMFIIDKCSIMHYLEPVGYENQYNRLYRTLQNTYAFFKDEKVPGPIVDIWINKVHLLQKEVESAKKLSDTDFGKACYNVLNTLFSLMDPIVFIHDGKLSRDCQILQDRLDDMSNNSLFYQAARLRRN